MDIQTAPEQGREWWSESWNLTRGCTPKGPLCDNCYAQHQAWRIWNMALSKSPDKRGKAALYEGLTKKLRNGKVVWTGKITLDPDALEDPLHDKVPRTYFCDSMSDLFHRAIDDRFIGKAVAVMAEAHWHTFIIVTKRIDRAVEFSRGLCHYPHGDSSQRPVVGFPPNVIILASVGLQCEADRIIPQLLQIPAQIRGLSMEPLLESVEFLHLLPADKTLQWIVVGGESRVQGRCRNTYAEHLRHVVAQSRQKSIPVLVKQMGTLCWFPASDRAWFESKELRMVLDPGNPELFRVITKDIKFANIDLFPPDLQIREFPHVKTI